MLIDTRYIQGAYIDRQKNKLNESKVKCTFEKKEKTIYSWDQEDEDMFSRGPNDVTLVQL